MASCGLFEATARRSLVVTMAQGGAEVDKEKERRCERGSIV